MLLQLQKFDLEVKYKPGRELAIADALSRDYKESQSKDSMDSNDEHIFYMSNSVSLENPTEYVSIKTDTFKEIKNATEKCD